MKIRKFVTAATTAAVLATGAVVAPAASALDLNVEGGICEITESYAGEQDKLAERFTEDVKKIFTQLKKKLPKQADDIDLILSDDTPTDEKEAALDRVSEAAEKEGFTEDEIFLILQLAPALIDPEEPFLQIIIGIENLTSVDAAADLLELKELRAALKRNELIFLPATSSDPAIAVFAKTKPTLLAIVDNRIELYESCAAGESGTFLVDLPDDHDRSFDRSVATSSY